MRQATCIPPTKESTARATRPQASDRAELRCPQAAFRPSNRDIAVMVSGACITLKWGAFRRSVLLLILFFEVTEDGPRVDAEVARGLGPVAVVQGEDLVDVVALELLLGGRERKDRRQVVTRQPQVLRAEEVPLGEDDRLLQSILQLADVSRPVVLLDRHRSVGREALHAGVVL